MRGDQQIEVIATANRPEGGASCALTMRLMMATPKSMWKGKGREGDYAAAPTYSPSDGGEYDKIHTYTQILDIWTDAG